jgi:hypothetical protein
MSGTNYLPTRQEELATWTSKFYTAMEANTAACNMTPELLTAYEAAQTAYADALAVATTPATRTPTAIETKDGLKAELVALTRRYVNICQASPLMTNPIRVDLQIPVRDTEPTPVPVPGEMPKLSVKMVRGNRLYLELLNQDNEKRKPVGARSAWLYSWVGESPSPDLTQWEFRGETTRSDPELDFPLSVGPDTEVWVAALWVNPTGKPGPACAPVKEYTNRVGMNQAA